MSLPVRPASRSPTTPDDSSTLLQNAPPRFHAPSQNERATRRKSVNSRTASNISLLRPSLIWFHYLLDEWWVLETISFAAAFALFGSYIYLLTHYNGKPTALWEHESALYPLFTSLPAAVSFLTTLMRGAMLFPVASAMGQLKWHYYRRPRRLLDIETMDAATRNVWGSLMLLFSSNWRYSITLGGIIMIASLFFGAFLQNTIHQDLLSLPATNETALIPVSTDYTVPYNHDRLQAPESLVAPTVIQAALAKGWSYWEGISPNDTSIATHLPVDCPSGNCTWTDAGTLHLLAECREAPFKVYNWTDPNDGFTRSWAKSTKANVSTMWISPDDPSERVLRRLFMQPSSVVPPGSAFASRQNRTAIVTHFAAIGNYPQDFTSFEAVECILFWQAVKYGLVEMEDRRLTETITAEHNTTEADIIPSEERNMTLTAPWPCNINTTSPTLSSAGDASCAYHISSKAHRGLANSLVPYLYGAVASFSVTSPNGSENTVTDFEDPLTELLLWSWANRFPPADEPAPAEPDDGPPGALLFVLTKYLENMAFFTSCALRARSPTRQNTFGTVYRAEVHYVVDFRYTAYPGALLALSVAFAAAVAWRTRGEPKWKNAQLPLLYHGLERTEGTGEGEGRGVRGVAGMEAAARRKMVRLVDEGEGLGLRLRGDGLRLRRIVRRADEEEGR